MIAIISPTYIKAQKWADTQNFRSDEWFYVADKADVTSRVNFHVIVIGEFPEERIGWFEGVYNLAKSCGYKR